MRVPLRIDPPLYTAFRALAYELGLSLNAAGNEAISEWVAKKCEDPALAEQVLRKVGS